MYNKTLWTIVFRKNNEMERPCFRDDYGTFSGKNVFYRPFVLFRTKKEAEKCIVEHFGDGEKKVLKAIKVKIMSVKSEP